MHDYNPGILPNHLFWTMELPSGAFRRNKKGTRARLVVNHLPMPNTFFYSNNVSVAGEISVDIKWEATGPSVRRGSGLDAVEPFWDKFVGHIRDAKAYGKGGGAHTGFKFSTGELTSDGFYASMGRTRNGVYLT